MPHAWAAGALCALYNPHPNSSPRANPNPNPNPNPKQVLFPSWLSHSVDRLEDDALDGGERRVAIAFNVHGWERT